MQKRYIYQFEKSVAESSLRVAFSLPASDKIDFDTLLKEVPFILKDIALRRAIEDRGCKSEHFIRSDCNYDKDEGKFTVVVTFKNPPND